MLIADNHASKLAYKLAKALLQPRDELQLVTVVLGEESVKYGSDLLAPYLPAAQQQNGPTITPVVRNPCILGQTGQTFSVDATSPNCATHMHQSLCCPAEHDCNPEGAPQQPLLQIPTRLPQQLYLKCTIAIHVNDGARAEFSCPT